jgi:hypothetical protein
MSGANAHSRALTVNDIVRLTGRSRRTVIRWLERTAGVILLFDHAEQMHKRRYRTFRVPRAVFEQIMRAKRIVSVPPLPPVTASETPPSSTQRACADAHV